MSRESNLYRLHKKRISKTKRAGLVFPVSRVLNQLKAGKYAEMIRVGSAIYLAAVLEYLAAELCEVAMYQSWNDKKKRIIPRHIQLAVAGDSELRELFKDVIISRGGVVPFINDNFIPKRSRYSNA